MSEKILIVGGTGMLGAPVARHLQQAGFGVRVLTRSPQRARQRFGDAFEYCAGDVEDPASLEPALQGCQGVHISLYGGPDPDLERRGAANIVKVSARAGIQRVTYISGASVCPENCWYDGTRARFQAEEAIFAACNETMAYTIFRCHFFMETLHKLVRGRMALNIGRQHHPYDWVAVDDYASMVARAYATPEAANKVLYVCGPEVLTMRQALQIFVRVSHPEARLMDLPIGMARLIARLGNRKELMAALPFFEYCDKVKIILSGSPAEANALLGAPSTTLEDWSRNMRG